MKARLERLRDETGADTFTEVIRRSLAVYEFMWKHDAAGDTVMILNEDEELTPVEFVWA